VSGCGFVQCGERYFHVVRVAHCRNPRRDVAAPQRSAVGATEHARAPGVDVVAVCDEEREAADAVPYGGRVEHEGQWRVEAPAQVGVEACA